MSDLTETTTTRMSGSGQPAGAVLHDALQEAVRPDIPEVQRLRHAECSVAFRVTDGPGPTVVLAMDHDGCRVREGGDADIEFLLTSTQAQALAVGELPMTAAIIGGTVEYSGPARRYLEVDVVLGRLLERGHAVFTRSASPSVSGRSSRAIDRDLLAIETRGLHKSFGPNEVLAGLDLTIPEGVIAVLLGPSGTGKSVCLQHIIGLMSPDAGDVIVRGRPLSEMHRTDLLDLRRDIGVMFQDGALFSTMNVFDNVAFPLRQHTDFDEPAVRRIVQYQLSRVGLGDAGSKMAYELSGGMRKRAGLARSMVLNPGIVLCDEPDSGLDPVRTALLGDLLLERHAEQGGTMVVVTHNVALARSIAEHMTVLWRGQVLESGMAEEILASETPFVRQFLSGATIGPLSMDA